MTVRSAQDKYVIRLPDGMRATIKSVADENHRSMNTEIVTRLAASIQGELSENQPWNPQVGMLVCLKTIPTTPWKLIDVIIHNNLILGSIERLDGSNNGSVELDDLKPYMVK